ncbi:MAG: N-acetylmuramoyl-L-alanine amidase, partial [Rhodothermia bacterium]|nr:N-acetylmuramoyl-L-alanine amidase [Rhodothermia bacterium]
MNVSTMKFAAFLFAVSVAGGLMVTESQAQVTGLAGWDIFLDPGHSQRENVGVFGYSEAEKNVRVGLALRDMLLETTDIDTVYMSRTNDFQQVSLTQRSDLANQIGATWFHSIHSDAGSPTVNSTLMLWGQNGDGTEKVPNGGQAMSSYMIERLTRGMRTTSRGSIGDCSFYGCSFSSGPWLSVNRRTSMPSELSESGFHTNPTQNQRNMNADWKVLEAKTFYWAILDFHGLARPAERIVTGIVSDFESEKPINGATVAIGDTTYTTDTFESLFNRYSSDPEKLSNGVYYLDDLPEGTLDITVTADGYRPFESQITPVDSFFTFVDVALISALPPVVVETIPAQADTSFRILDDIFIEFSRPMDQSSVETAFAINPDLPGTLAWPDSRTLKFIPDSLPPETDVSITIAGTASGQFGDLLDGNGDGTAGDAFALAFRTGPPDALAPRILTSRPVHNSVDNDRQPVITVQYDERLIEDSVQPGRFRLTPSAGGSSISGFLRHHVVRDQSVVQFFPLSPLEGDVLYRFDIDPGVSDEFGNIEENPKRFFFRTRLESQIPFAIIDDFEADVESNWWVPQQSGTTTGIVTDSTGRSVESMITIPWNGTSAFRIDYGWDESSSTWLIREFLLQGPPKAVTFDGRYVLSALVFGDASGNLLRFAVDDRLPDTAAAYHEVSPWFEIDWRGWKRVEWDMSTGETGTWIGDGNLDGTLRFDSFQLSHVAGAELYGSIVIDDLELYVIGSPVAVDDSEVPEQLKLSQNYPNPFNPTTTIAFELPATGQTRLTVFDIMGREIAVLVDGVLQAG